MSSQPEHPTTPPQTIQTCQNVIKFTPDGRKYEHGFQSARVPPNQRLVHTFGIDNSFTTFDNKRKSEFKSETIKKMKAAVKLVAKTNEPEDWTDLCEHAKAACQEYLERKKEEVNLSEMVQYVTLKTSLCYLFDDAEAALKEGDRFEAIVLIGRRINELWLASKQDNDGEQPKWENEKELQDALRNVTVSANSRKTSPNSVPEPEDPVRNPMNFLLPAYETMWRVVLRCYLEIRYRNAPEDSETRWSRILTTYISRLSTSGTEEKPFHNPAPTDLKSIDIVKEALRLYPPTRRVHREFFGELHKADIEACHRSSILAGPDPLVFRPERWKDICPAEREMDLKALKAAEQALGYMPFAYWCTADTQETRAFGMKMIALLVGVLCDGVSGEWRLKEGNLPLIGIPLDPGRAAYEDLVVRRQFGKDVEEEGK